MRLVHFHGIRDSWKEDHIPIGQHLDDWIGEELVLSRFLLMGYPTVPQSDAQVLVVAAGEVNAIVDKYAGPGLRHSSSLRFRAVGSAEGR